MDHQLQDYLDSQKISQCIPEEFQRVAQALAAFAQRGHSAAMTPVQLEHFLLNKVEFPTDFGRYQQVILELDKRYFDVCDLVARLEEATYKIRLIKKEMDKEEDDDKRRLLEIKAARKMLAAKSLRRRITALLQETNFFLQVWDRVGYIDELPPEEKHKLELDFWARKAMNMPDTFEQRYGEEFMIAAWGKDKYDMYLQARRKMLGLLPRELARLQALQQGEQCESKLQASEEMCDGGILPSKLANVPTSQKGEQGESTLQPGNR